MCPIILCILTIVAVSSALPSGISGNDSALLPRIIDGDLSFKQYYYEIAIIAPDPTPAKLCSGAMISTKWALTSAFCAKRRPILRVVCGTNTAYPPPYGNGGQLVERVHCHPYFNSVSLIHDIALLELAAPVTTDYVTVALLPPNAILNYVGQSAIISGWGAVAGVTPTTMYTLQFKQTTIIDNGFCTREGHFMSPYKLCTEDRAVCEGDQGAPLVQGNTIIGIASAAHDASKCEGAVVTSYTRVNYYLGWIQQVTKNYPCNTC